MATLKLLMDMSGRRALITGAAGELGRMIADSFAEMGAELLLVDIQNAPIKALATELADRHGVTAIPFVCNLEYAEDRLTLVEKVLRTGGLSVLVNNAAFVGTSDLSGWSEPFEKQSIDTWRRALEVNLTSAFHLSQLFAPALKAGPGGNIINIASIYGEWGPDWSLYEGTNMANPAAYGASKGGLIQLTRWLATTLGPHVRANAISPGGIARNQAEIFVDRYSARTPLGRMATEEDFRGAIAYLATDLSAYVTGQVINVDGGWGIW